MTMMGRHSRVVKRVRDVAPLLTHVHCCIHREALAAKRMPMDLKTSFWTMLSEGGITSKVVHCKHVCFPFCVKRWVVDTACFFYIQRSTGSHAAECSPGSSRLRDEVRTFLIDSKLELASVLQHTIENFSQMKQ